MYFTKRFIFLLILFALFIKTNTSIVNAQAQNQILIINQVRGEECCEPGSLENLQKQIKILEKLELPAFFTLRYDVLTNPKFINYLKNLNKEHFQLGLFLEITPELAQAAGVEYRGNEDNWYQAQHAYLLGYDPVERKKIIDKIFLSFKNIFGRYPELTTAWVIDTDTLNYLHDQYGVKVHQITREQWGTDSYTLDGGPAHHPYPASRSWLFMSDYEATNSTLIVRQTVTDPLYNYGDPHSFFTSQPNDYLQDGKSLDYFKNLLRTTLNQPAEQPGLALLGLENSMAEKYQVEFEQQLEFAKQLKNEQVDLEFISKLDNLITKYSDRLINIYTNFDDESKITQPLAIFITTSKYRLRLRIQAEKIFIDDLRIYNSNLADPYNNYVAVNRAYLISPFLINGARFFQLPQTFKSFFQKNPWWQEFGLRSTRDVNNQPNQLTLADRKLASPLTLAKTDREIELNYISKKNKEIKITFRADNFGSQGIELKELNYLNYNQKLPIEFSELKQGSRLVWPNEQAQAVLSLDIACNNLQCSFDPQLDSEKFTQLRKSAYPYFFPEVKPAEISQENSQIIPHNRYAIAGRNPARVIFLFKDKNNFPVTAKQQINLNTQAKISHGEVDELENGVYFTDLFSNQVQSAKINLSLSDDEFKKDFTVYFAPNCKKSPGYCATHPIHTWWYLRTLISDWVRG